MSEADLTGAIHLFYQSKEKTMALIQTVEPDRAEGKVKEIYDFMQKNAGVIPAPLQLASASPQMLDVVWQSIQYYSQHPNLGFGLLSSIRYLVAQQYEYAFCTDFNRNMLKIQGLSDEDIEKMEKILCMHLWMTRTGRWWHL